MTRRFFLKALGGAAASALAGGTVLGGCTGEKEPVSLMAAGSLAHFAEHRLQPVLAERGVALQHEARGSAIVARLVASGRRRPDLVALADPALFRVPFNPSWYATFATNALVVACARTEGGRRVQQAGSEGWFRPILEGRARLGRTDPDADPLGYRALFLFDLATRYYERSSLAGRLREASVLYPETALLGQLETGAIDVAIAYRNMAVERDYAFVPLPPELDLSRPALAEEWYATVSYMLPGGKTVTGSPIRYAATVLHDRPAAWRTFTALTAPGTLQTAGFEVPAGYPRFRGQRPAQAQRNRAA